MADISGVLGSFESAETMLLMEAVFNADLEEHEREVLTATSSASSTKRIIKTRNPPKRKKRARFSWTPDREHILAEVALALNSQIEKETAGTGIVKPYDKLHSMFAERIEEGPTPSSGSVKQTLAKILNLKVSAMMTQHVGKAGFGLYRFTPAAKMSMEDFLSWTSDREYLLVEVALALNSQIEKESDGTGIMKPYDKLQSMFAERIEDGVIPSQESMKQTLAKILCLKSSTMMTQHGGEAGFELYRFAPEAEMSMKSFLNASKSKRVQHGGRTSDGAKRQKVGVAPSDDMMLIIKPSFEVKEKKILDFLDI